MFYKGVVFKKDPYKEIGFQHADFALQWQKMSVASEARWSSRRDNYIRDVARRPQNNQSCASHCFS